MFLIPLTDLERLGTGFSHKAIIAAADLTAAATTQTFAIMPYQPPGILVNNALQTQTAGYLAAGACIKKAAVNCTTLFSGGGLSAMVIDVGDGASVGRYVANATTDLFTTGTGNSKNPVLGSTGYAYTPSDVNANHSQVQAKLTATGCNLSVVTTGQVEIYFDLVDMARMAVTTEPGTP